MASWQGTPPDWSAPATRAASISPADSDFANGVIYRALWVGGAGNLTVRMADDSGDVTLSGVPAGTLLPLAVKRVAATTTATLIVGLR